MATAQAASKKTTGEAPLQVIRRLAPKAPGHRRGLFSLGAMPLKSRHERIIGIAGFSGSGKTTLIEKVIPVLVREGLRVSLVKHAHHEFDVDQPGQGLVSPPPRGLQRGAGELVEALGADARAARRRRAHAPGALAAPLAVRPGDRRGLQERADPQARGAPPRGAARRCCIPSDPHVVAVATDEPLDTSLPQIEPRRRRSRRALHRPAPGLEPRAPGASRPWSRCSTSRACASRWRARASSSRCPRAAAPSPRWWTRCARAASAGREALAAGQALARRREPADGRPRHAAQARRRGRVLPAGHRRLSMARVRVQPEDFDVGRELDALTAGRARRRRGSRASSGSCATPTTATAVQRHDPRALSRHDREGARGDLRAGATRAGNCSDIAGDPPRRRAACRAIASCWWAWRARIAARPSRRASSSWITSRPARRSGRRKTRRRARAGSRRAPATTPRAALEVG